MAQQAEIQPAQCELTDDDLVNVTGGGDGGPGSPGNDTGSR